VETTRITEFYLNMQYGESVQVEHVDLANPEVQAEFPELVALAEERNLPYPLVAINDELRLAGSVQYHQVMPLVEQALAEESSVPAE
jgi:disulfide oxidoreductase YuzD